MAAFDTFLPVAMVYSRHASVTYASLIKRLLVGLNRRWRNAPPRPTSGNTCNAN